MSRCITLRRGAAGCLRGHAKETVVSLKHLKLWEYKCLTVYTPSGAIPAHAVLA